MFIIIGLDHYLEYHRSHVCLFSVEWCYAILYIVNL